MSRSKRGSKSSGYEYWSRRPNCKGAVGKSAKRIIHGQEREINKQIVREELALIYSE